MNKKRFSACILFLLNFFFSAFSQSEFPNTANIIDELYNYEQVLPSPEKPADRPSVALILSGGGARGFAHLPVLELLEKYEIPVDIVIGTSIGAIIGGIYCCGYSVAEMEEEFFSLDWSDIFQDKVPELYESRLSKVSKAATPFSINFKKTDNGTNLNLGSGILSGQYAYEFIKKMTLSIPSNCNFDDLPIPFRAVSVNLTSGNIEVFGSGDIAEAIRSSMSIPGFFQPFRIDGQYYIDGGTRNNTPIDIAVKMGYDIIIVSEISSKLNQDYESFKSSPVTALQQMTNIEQAVRNREAYKQASLVVFPDYGNATILDFTKAKKIYSDSLASMEEYKTGFEKIKNEISAKTYSEKFSAKKNTSFNTDYKKNPLPVVTSFSVTGGDEQDVWLIQRTFSSIRGKELTPELYESFEKSIYKSGKYENVVTRIKKINFCNSNIEIILSKKQQKELSFSLGMDYKGTLSTDAMNDFSMIMQIQKEGFLGKGSIFSIRGSFFTDYSITMEYIQPLGNILYTILSLSCENDRSLVSSGLDYYPIQAEQVFKNIMEFSIGIPVSSWFVFSLGINAGIYNTEEKIEHGCQTSATSIFGKTVINSFDSNCLPVSGLLLDSSLQSIFPIEKFDKDVYYDVESINIEAVIPLTKKISTSLKAFTGGNFTENLSEYPELISIFGFPLADRIFFPQIAASGNYGVYKAAAGASLIFCPWSQLSILGGRAFFAASGAIGNIWQKREEISKDSPVWRSSIDLGIRFSDSFGILLRTGMGKTRGEIEPFISLDIGKVRL